MLYEKYKLLAGILLASLSLNSCYDLDRYPSDQVSDGIFGNQRRMPNKA